MAEKIKKHRKILSFFFVVILLFVLNHVFSWSDYIAKIDNLNFLRAVVEENIWLALLIYFVITVISSVLLAVPGVSFAILASLLFGPILGTIACVFSAGVGAVISFICGRYFLRDSIKPLAMKNRYLKKWLFSDRKDSQLFILMITRLVPLFPYNLQNFAYGVTDISFSLYSIGTFIFIIPGTAMYTFGTAGIADGKNRYLYIGIALLIAIIVVALANFLKKSYVVEEE